jgi:hypothetical protein
LAPVFSGASFPTGLKGKCRLSGRVAYRTWEGLGKKSTEVFNTNTFRHCNADFLHLWNVIDGVHLLDVFWFQMAHAQCAAKGVSHQFLTAGWKVALAPVFLGASFPKDLKGKCRLSRIAD